MKLLASAAWADQDEMAEALAYQAGDVQGHSDTETGAARFSR